MTRDEARAYFRDKGLTYEDITVTDLSLLAVLLDLYFTKRRKETIKDTRHNAEPVYWQRTNGTRLLKCQFDERGRLIFATITGKGDQFTARQVISFNRDGHIGFCGAVSDVNAEPVLAAFVEWVDEMAAIKEIGERGDGGSGSGEVD